MSQSCRLTHMETHMMLFTIILLETGDVEITGLTRNVFAVCNCPV